MLTSSNLRNLLMLVIPHGRIAAPDLFLQVYLEDTQLNLFLALVKTQPKVAGRPSPDHGSLDLKPCELSEMRTPC